ncbi:MAG: DUF4097 family beta strand repeat-containing protein [Bryobacteraceae bacterium]
MRWRLAFLPAVLLALAGCEDSGAPEKLAYREDFHRTYALRAGGTISLDTFNGAVEIAGWDGDTVDVEGSKFAASPDLRDSIELQIQSEPGSLRIAATFPKKKTDRAGARFRLRVPRHVEIDHVATSNAAVRVQDIDGSIKLRTTNAAVSSERIRGSVEVITTNGGVELHEISGPAFVRTSNGRVMAEGVYAGIDAVTSNGSIAAEIKTSEPRRLVKLETTNGSIDLSLDKPLEHMVQASTSNAGITVRMREDAGAQVRATTSNAPISTDFDVKSDVERFSRLEGTIGDGAASLNLSTSNASIQLMKKNRAEIQ